ncbi:hypothetical protein K443DRAFT_675239 [Laccaria amethystina LaAM-08-1]|uniref:Uncharacterized protein n=1 Tax=Laccaria amethystina LaAM-08-1 TaxID=1095629 RepID=A0A0C9Y547_9AGAR|nr:hypothetical protein K443DRAFT_675239 [Laccaria amethystina LaAM-08-1]
MCWTNLIPIDLWRSYFLRPYLRLTPRVQKDDPIFWVFVLHDLLWRWIRWMKPRSCY